MINYFKIHNIEAYHCCCFEYFKNIQEKSVDLVLTDPPYLISRDTGFSAGDIVCDPFFGSLTTGISGINTKRKFTGCELNAEYFTKSIERIKIIDCGLLNI